MQKKRPTKGRTSLPRCRITGTASVYQRPEKRQHNPASPKENPSKQERDKRQSRKRATPCLNDGTTGKAVKARLFVWRTSILSAAPVAQNTASGRATTRPTANTCANSRLARESKPTQTQEGLGRCTSQSRGPLSRAPPDVHIPKKPKVCVIAFPPWRRGFARLHNPR